MERFSWSDNLRAAFSPCLACLSSRRDEDDEERQQFNHHRATNAHGPDYVPRARPDELEGLLADSDDADAMSLHSNIGRDDARKRKRHRLRKGIKLFGFDLFGKPPIQLPEDDDALPDQRPVRSRTISASTMDSDASPLDPSMIDQLSAARLAEGEAQREAERQAKEERRRRRREKKAAREAALALALDTNEDGEEFEGFPGSGRYLMSPDAPSSSGYDESDDFGPFAQAQNTSLEQADVDGADFGAEAYAKRPRRGGSSGTGSDSRSRSSASHSRGDSIQHSPIVFSQGQPQPNPLSPGFPAAPRRKKSKSSRQSISSASQSNSITSPPAGHTTFPVVASHDRSPLAEHSIIADQPIITIDTPNGFPSVGFSGGMRRKNSEAGVFLANRG